MVVADVLIQAVAAVGPGEHRRDLAHAHHVAPADGLLTVAAAIAAIDSFGTRGHLDLAGTSYALHRLAGLAGIESLPLSRKIILENLLRHEDGVSTTAGADHRAPRAGCGGHEVAFLPSRVFLHDTNGVPVLTDLAALRDAVVRHGGDAATVRAGRAG